MKTSNLTIWIVLSTAMGLLAQTVDQTAVVDANASLPARGQKEAAESDNLEVAVLSFPEVRADAYQMDVTSHSANVLIAAGSNATCNALERLITANRDLRMTNPAASDRANKVNTKLCHLTRLLFISPDSVNPLQPPRVGLYLFLPVLSMNEKDWPDLPFFITNNLALSMNLGYGTTGIPEDAGNYLNYCKANGVFRTELLSEPTFLSASNSLSQLFDSQRWKSLEWADTNFGYSYTLDENDTKKMLWRQVENIKHR